MNNFTKEELETLNNVLLHSREDYPALRHNSFCTRLLNKIQSMIDNYCEHEMIHRKSNETPIEDDEPILCRFERIVYGKWETYLSVGPFNYKEMKKTLKSLIAIGEYHDHQ